MKLATAAIRGVRQIGRDALRVLHVAIVSLYVAILVVVLGAVIIGGVCVTTAALNTLEPLNGASVAVIALGLLAVVAVALPQLSVSRKETQHYDELRPWMTTAEQVLADRRLRQQVARYAEQKRRTAAVTTGEHEAIGSRFP